MPKISFVVLTYNSQDYIEKLLKSIFNLLKDDIERRRAEVIVVDNDSNDRTLVIVREFANVKVIKNKENLGFSKGINIGALHSGGEFVIFINPDGELREGNLGKLVGAFEENKKIAVVGGKIVGKKKEEKSVGKFLNLPELFLVSVGLDELFGVRSSPSEIKEVDFVSGGFMIVRKDIFKKLSGFDESFFMYVEDMEFCYRVRKEGYKVLFDPRISIYHHGHGSSNRGFAIANIYKGLLYFYKKHKSPLSYSVARFLLLFKARLLVIIGKILNNRYLTDTYSQALKV